MSSSQEIVNAIRSILTSRKGAATLKDIRSDYENLMGRLKMNDAALEALMRSFRSDFTVFEKDGVRYFNSRCKETSQHIARLVAVAKSTPKKKPGRVQIQVPKKFHNNARPASYNQTAYSNIYRPPAMRTNQPLWRQDSWRINNNNNNNNMKTQNLNTYPKKPAEIERKPQEIKQPPRQQESRPTSNPHNYSTAIPRAPLQTRLKVEEVPKLQLTSLTNRLTKNREINPQDLMAAREYEQRSSVPNTPTSPTGATSPMDWDVERFDDFQKLEYYSKLNGFKPPVYKCIKTKCTDDLDMRKKDQYNAFLTVSFFYTVILLKFTKKS
jgi:hypothetical protein